MRLDEQTSVLDVSAEALEAGDQDSLLACIKYILRVQDRGRVESIWSGTWVLLKCFVCENGVQFITEGDIVDQATIVREGKV